MDPLTLTITAAGLGAGVVSVVASVNARHALARVWLEAARQAGLTDVVLRTEGRWRPRVEGRHGPLDVRIESRFTRYARRTGTRIVVSGLTRRLELRPAVLFKDGGGRRDIRVGDNAFDAELFVSGEPPVASALLDERTRHLVRDLFAMHGFEAGRGLVEEKGVRLETGGLVSERVRGDRLESTASHLRDLVALADRLREPVDVPARLAANAREDRNPAVRRACLHHLAEQADRAPALAGLRRALEDPDEDVRLEAALALGPEGHAALVAIVLAEIPLDGNVARAVRALQDALPVDQARFVLARAVRARHLQTAAACLETLSQRGPEQSPMIARVLELEQGELAVAAARALGRVGTATAVPLLHEAEARSARDGALRTAVRDAIASIRARLSGADAGQVSLADGPAGNVSFASGEEGRLSVATEQKGSSPSEEP